MQSDEDETSDLAVQVDLLVEGSEAQLAWYRSISLSALGYDMEALERGEPILRLV